MRTQAELDLFRHFAAASKHADVKAWREFLDWIEGSDSGPVAMFMGNRKEPATPQSLFPKEKR